MVTPTLDGETGQSFGTIDTAVSDTARELREELQTAINPPGTSRYARRLHTKALLYTAAVQALRENSLDQQGQRRLVASVPWAETFVDTALATAPIPDVAVDSDGEILLEWLEGPREVLTVSIGAGGIVQFASLAGSDRLHGVTRIGGNVSAPLLTRLGQVKRSATR